MKHFGRWLRSRFGREDGNAMVEFVILLPMFITIVTASFESGLTMMRLNMLQHGLDVTMRDLRLGKITNPTQAELVNEICENVAMVSNCSERLLVEVTPIENWVLPSSNIACIRTASDIQPIVNLNIGQENQLMLVRACLVQDLIFSASGLALSLPSDHNGEFNLFAVSAYVNEPS